MTAPFGDPALHDHFISRKAFIAAMSAFQAEVRDPEKTATNPHFKSRFADLHGIFQTVRPLLAKHGFAVTQTMGFRDGADVLTTTLWHKDGFSVSGDMRLAIAQQTPQGMGSAVTYAKRYSLSAILGLASRDEDDDGEEAERPRQEAPKPATRPAAAPKASGEAPAKVVAMGSLEEALNGMALIESKEDEALWGRRVKAGVDGGYLTAEDRTKIEAAWKARQPRRSA